MIRLFYRRGKIYLKSASFKGRGYIMLLGMPSSIHILTATLQIKDNDPSRGFKARDVVNLCSTSTWVTVPLGVITALLADIATFNAAVGAAKITAWNNINTGLKSVMRLFSDEMGLDPTNAREICESGGFKVKGVGIKQEQVFGITQGTLSGTIDCVGNTSKKDHCHDWLLNFAGGPFVRQRPTPKSKKQFTGLTPGTYGVQHQLILANGDDGPLQTIYIDLI